MARSSRVRRALPAVLLVGTLVGLSSIAAPARATDAAHEEEAAPAEDGGPSWGAIIGACMGVLFGGGLALWQIRGMKNRG